MDELDPETFLHYTHQGLRHVKRLMFGINSASEIFNEEIKQTLVDINRTNIYDDILVYGKDKREHEEDISW